MPLILNPLNVHGGKATRQSKNVSSSIAAVMSGWSQDNMEPKGQYDTTYTNQYKNTGTGRIILQEEKKKEKEMEVRVVQEEKCSEVKKEVKEAIAKEVSNKETKEVVKEKVETKKEKKMEKKMEEKNVKSTKSDNKKTQKVSKPVQNRAKLIESKENIAPKAKFVQKVDKALQQKYEAKFSADLKLYQSNDAGFPPTKSVSDPKKVLELEENFSKRQLHNKVRRFVRDRKKRIELHGEAVKKPVPTRVFADTALYFFYGKPPFAQFGQKNEAPAANRFTHNIMPQVLPNAPSVPQVFNHAVSKALSCSNLPVRKVNGY